MDENDDDELLEEEDNALPPPMEEVTKDAMARIVLRSESRHPVSGVATGFLELDDITAGLHPGQLVVLASRPSIGKSALALNICQHAILANKTPALFITLEMNRLDINDHE